MDWSSDPCFNPRIRIAMIEERLSKLASERQTPESNAEHSLLTLELECLYEYLLAYWRQRSKTGWMREGDRNTAYFHAKATKRFEVNHVVSLQDRNGNL